LQGLSEVGVVGGTTPIVMMGYSYGTYVAYECARRIQQHFKQRVSHLVSVAGIPAAQLDSRMTAWQSYPGDTPVHQLQSLLAATNGGEVPEEFSNLDFLGPALIIGIVCGMRVFLLPYCYVQLTYVLLC
jgi:pimeloyl-ACP methyl ester carboxylesterase